MDLFSYMYIIATGLLCALGERKLLLLLLWHVELTVCSLLLEPPAPQPSWPSWEKKEGGPRDVHLLEYQDTCCRLQDFLSLDILTLFLN